MVARPINITQPIIENKSKLERVINKEKKAPQAANGITAMIVYGVMNDPYKLASTKKMNITPSPIETRMFVINSAKRSASPTKLKVTPAGGLSSSLLMRLISAITPPIPAPPGVKSADN
ncbi:hypothetical protein D3C87_1704180 [compost metagenome]